MQCDANACTSSHAAAGHDPSLSLAGELGDALVVGVVVEDRQPGVLGGRFRHRQDWLYSADLWPLTVLGCNRCAFLLRFVLEVLLDWGMEIGSGLGWSSGSTSSA
jgi:hypothetical protein